MSNKIVLGGGIGGLSAAYYLRKKFPLDPIYLIEASDRVGGWIRSTKQNEGHIFELGPRTIRPKGMKGKNTLQLIEELELEKEITSIPSKHPAARKRMIYVNGRLHTLPSSLIGIFRTLPPFSKPLISYLSNDITAPSKLIPKNDESIYSFVQRRFGKEIADYAISPLICGICAGNAQDISVKFLMEELFNYEQAHGSITKGILFNAFRSNKQGAVECNLSKRAKKENWSVYSFKNGLEVLPKKLGLINKQNGVQYFLKRKCTKIEFDDDAILSFGDGGTLTTDHLISSVSSRTLGNLIMGHKELKEMLQSIPFVNVCVINLHYKTKVLNKKAFGFLVPPVEKLPILGVIFDSCCFPNGNNTVLTVMMGGHWFKDYFGDSPSEDYLLEVALKQLSTILDIQQKPSSYKINVLNDCIPQYVVGHNKKIDQIQNYINKHNLPLHLCGSSYHGVGINDVIYSAKTTVDAIEINGNVIT